MFASEEQPNWEDERFNYVFVGTFNVNEGDAYGKPNVKHLTNSFFTDIIPIRGKTSGKLFFSPVPELFYFDDFWTSREYCAFIPGHRYLVMLQIDPKFANSTVLKRINGLPWNAIRFADLSETEAQIGKIRTMFEKDTTKIYGFDALRDGGSIVVLADDFDKMQLVLSKEIESGNLLASDLLSSWGPPAILRHLDKDEWRIAYAVKSRASLNPDLKHTKINPDTGRKLFWGNVNLTFFVFNANKGYIAGLKTERFISIPPKAHPTSALQLEALRGLRR